LEDYKLKVYLAGYSKYLEYRKIIKQKYGREIIIIDPLTYDLEDVYDNIGKKLSDIYIVKRDKRLIDDCDILVAKVEYLQYGELSAGTIMECIYAYMKGIPVFLISSEKNILNDFWLKFHSKERFNTIEECFEFILRKND
jgi:nucleoside 2-deoxyribosyltransferase